MHADLVRRRILRKRRQRSGQFTVERLTRGAERGGDRARGRGRVCGVGDQKQPRFFAADELAREIGRNLNDELHLVREDQFVGVGLAARDIFDVEIIGGAQGADQRARDRAVVACQHGRRQMFGIGVDRISKEHQLNDRNADDHREGRPVATKLNEFLDEHRDETLPGLGERAASRRTGNDVRQAFLRAHWSAPARVIKSMNTSSSDGSSRLQ